MQTQVGHQRHVAPAVVGAVLVIIGIGAFALQGLGVEIGQAIGDGGWPLFVLLPGLILLGAAFAVTPPRGVGFAIAGSIVTAVGFILWFQNATGLWETWAYAWALIPTAAGLGLLGYGLLAHDRRMTGLGASLAGIGGILFLTGMWFFGPVFEGGQPPIDLGERWPVMLVAAGLVILVWAILDGSHATTRVGDRVPPPAEPGRPA
jgi:hypothetical protein